MSLPVKEQLVMDARLSKEPIIGHWLWAIQETRQRTMRVLEGLTSPVMAWLPPGNESGIATILYHIADIEADWLYVEVLEQEVPPEVMALFPIATRDSQGHLSQVQGFSLEEHLGRLETVRGLLLGVFQQMEFAEFRRIRSLTHYDVTPEFVLHHLMQHEAEHRSQIGALRARAEQILA